MWHTVFKVLIARDGGGLRSTSKRRKFSAMKKTTWRISWTVQFMVSNCVTHWVHFQATLARVWLPWAWCDRSKQRIIKIITEQTFISVVKLSPGVHSINLIMESIPCVADKLTGELLTTYVATQNRFSRKNTTHPDVPLDKRCTAGWLKYIINGIQLNSSSCRTSMNAVARQNFAFGQDIIGAFKQLNAAQLGSELRANWCEQSVHFGY